jgi:probable F420-dependent oxidoreductase
VKVRIGWGLGAQRDLGRESLTELVDGLEQIGFDSLWLSERMGSPAPDPTIGLTFAAARTSRIKLGTSVQVLPGRNPAVVAKQWASLDVLSGGRTLPAFGLGAPDPNEHQAFGVQRDERAAWFDEALPLIRRLWTEPEVDHDGARFTYRGLRLEPKPIQQPPDVWLGGKARSELRRTGRLGDGWLASFATPGDCKDGRPIIEEAASEAGRAIDDEHFGAMVLYAHHELPAPFLELIGRRSPERDPADLVPIGGGAVRTRLEEFIAVGFSKLVLVPLEPAPTWTAELEAAAPLLELQN